MPISKLAAYRRKKGLSQEQLADLSGVSARTIQRIESGTVEAHLATIKMLADCLGVDTELLLEEEPIETIETTGKPKKLAPMFHALALFGLFLPVLNIILPGFLWLLKRDELPEYDSQGKQVINFQLTMSIAFIPSVVLLIYFFPLGFLLIIFIYFYAVIMSLINLLRSINQQPIRYPLTFVFIK